MKAKNAQDEIIENYHTVQSVGLNPLKFDDSFELAIVLWWLSPQLLGRNFEREERVERMLLKRGEKERKMR